MSYPRTATATSLSARGVPSAPGLGFLATLPYVRAYVRGLRFLSGPRAAAAIGCVLATLACGDQRSSDAPHAAEETADADPQLVFWAALQDLCGRAFEGRLVESVPPDESFAGRRLVMHVRECDAAEIRIPFYVGDDRSRTWVVTTTATGLRLKHDHRHEDGSEDEITQYGGDTAGRGDPAIQEFHADAHTAALLPAAATNVWTIEVHPDSMYAYALRREGTDRRFRVEFDLTTEVEEPPPPWQE